METKWGPKTTEFWAMLVPLLLQLLTAFGVVEPSQGGALDMSTIGGAAYGVGRGIAKHKKAPEGNGTGAG